MSEEKQIEEMARIIAKANGNEQDAAYYRPDATDLYNTGYRKASEVALKVIDEIEKTFKDCLWFLENHPSDYPRMDRTKINVYKDNLLHLAELKKKYTEGK